MTEPSKAVFLSYASQDSPAAERICNALKAAGIEPWFDQSELRGGDVWDQKIRQQIRDCALFIPVISANTAVRHEGYFRLEWNLADQRTHMMARNKAFIIPVCVDATKDTGADVPDSFARVQWTRLPGGETPPAFTKQIARLLAADDPASPAQDRKSFEATTRAPPPRRRVLLGAAALLTVIAVGVVMAIKMTSRGKEIGLVAVLPFENATGDASIDYLSDGISESLITKLASVNGLRVISRTSAFAFKGRRMDAAEIGRQLGAEALVLGSVALRGDSLAITAELVRVSDATQLWGDKYARRSDDVMQVEGEIATTIARNLRPRLSGEARVKLTRTATTDPEAYRLYLKGRDFLVGTSQEMDKSVDYFQQAVARAPDYALAHAGLAEAYTRQAFLRAAGRTQSLDMARAAARRALELEPDLAEAHTALALVRFYFEWDWAGAETEFRRALELNRGSEATHEEYGIFLAAMGRLDEALAESSEAARLDPLSVSPAHDVAIIALTRHDYDQAAAGFRRTLAIDPNWTWGYIKLARALALQKNCKESFAQADIAESRIAGGPAPLSNAWLGVTYAMCGDNARARQKLDALNALEKKQYVDSVPFAQIHAALGEMDEAMRRYEKAFADRTPNMVFARVLLNVSPELAAEPRYVAIVEKMGFPK